MSTNRNRQRKKSHDRLQIKEDISEDIFKKIKYMHFNHNEPRLL